MPVPPCSTQADPEDLKPEAVRPEDVAAEPVDDGTETPCIFIIENDPTLREALVVALYGEGYEIAAFDSGDGAVEAARRVRPQLLITELLMEPMDGVTLIREIRADFPDLPIVAMSAGGRLGAERYLNLSTKLGATYTLRKPFELDALRELARRALGARTIARPRKS